VLCTFSAIAAQLLRAVDALKTPDTNQKQHLAGILRVMWLQ
jgi:hypothetical protein